MGDLIMQWQLNGNKADITWIYNTFLFKSLWHKKNLNHDYKFQGKIKYECNKYRIWHSVGEGQHMKFLSLG